MQRRRLFVGFCLWADVHRGIRLPGAFAGRDVRRAFIRAADRNRPERLPHAVTPSCGACGSEHAEPCPCLCGNASDRSLLPTLPDGSGGSSPAGRSAAFMAGMVRLRPFTSSCRPARPFVRAGRTRCNQKRYFSCFTLSTSRWMSAQASSPKVVPTTSITLPAVMAPIVPHWRSDSPSHNPARKPAA